jgi:hypothetical protein
MMDRDMSSHSPSGARPSGSTQERIRAWLKLPPTSWPPDPYTLLGLPPGETDVGRIERHAQERIHKVRAYQLRHPEEATLALNCLAQALVSLTESQRNGRFDPALQPPPIRAESGPTEPIDDFSAESDYSEAEKRKFPIGIWLSGLVCIGGVALALVAARLAWREIHTDAHSAPAAAVWTSEKNPGSVWSVAFSRDGRLAWGSDDHRVFLGSLDATRPVYRLVGHAGAIRSVAFSRDGKYLLSGSTDDTIGLWSVATGEKIKDCNNHSGPIHCLAFSPDGRQFGSGSQDQTVRWWDVPSGKARACFTDMQGAVLAVGFSANGDQLFACGKDSMFRRWHLDAAAAAPTGDKVRSKVSYAAFAANCHFALAGDGDELVRYETATGHMVKFRWEQAGRIVSVALSPEGRRALAGCADGSVRLLDIEGQRDLGPIGSHHGAVVSVAFSYDGRQALSGGADGMVRLWKLPE